MARLNGMTTSKETTPVGKGSSGDDGMIAFRHYSQIVTNAEIIT